MLLSEYLFTLHQSVAQDLRDMWRATFEIGAGQLLSLLKSRRDHRAYVDVNIPTLGHVLYFLIQNPLSYFFLLTWNL